MPKWKGPENGGETHSDSTQWLKNAKLGGRPEIKDKGRDAANAEGESEEESEKEVSEDSKCAELGSEESEREYD
jgi:hypothetical protein